MKIYFIHQGMQSFVRKDFKILSERHEVRAINNFRSTARKIFENLKGVLWCDIVFCWFCSLRFFVPIVCGKLLGKKVVLVAGGYDVVNLPQIRYGSMQGGWTTRLHKQLFKLADHVICPSRSNMGEAIHNADIPPEKITMIYHGFEKVPPNQMKKQNIVVTVGRVTEENMLRKGLAFFLEVARYFPEVPFLAIGSLDDGIKEKIEKIAPPNFRLTGFVSDQELEEYFSCAKVYVQASMHEGFGCSVAEAMLHECIPVVSNCYALSEVVAQTGYLFEPGDLDGLKNKIDLALNDQNHTGRKARERVEKEFSYEARKTALLNLVNSLQC